MNLVSTVLLVAGLVYCEDVIPENGTSLMQNEPEQLENNYKGTKFVELQPQEHVLKHNFILPWLQPVTDAVKNFVILTKHPNYGGFQLLNPLNLWQKHHDKGGNYFGGPYGATFGTALNAPVDYPFAYRNTKN